MNTKILAELLLQQYHLEVFRYLFFSSSDNIAIVNYQGKQTRVIWKYTTI